VKKTISNILQSPYKWLAAAVFLYLLSFFFSNQFSGRYSLKQESGKLEDYLNKNSNDFEKLSSDTSLLKRLSTRSASREEYDRIIKSSFGFFLAKKFSSGEKNLLFWSNQESAPVDDLYKEPDGDYFKKLDNGYYLCIKKSFLLNREGDTAVAFGLIPVLYDYFVETGYLPNKFAHSKNAELKISISQDSTPYPVQNTAGKILFYIKEKGKPMPADTSGIVFWLRLLATLLLLLFIHFSAEKTAKQRGIVLGIFILGFGLLLLRVLSYYTTFPVNLSQFELFDPAIFGANPIQKSLGDLMINAIFFCWITLFIWNKVRKLNKDWQTYFPRKLYRVCGVLGLIAIVAFTFIIAKTIHSLAADSNISFDVINFFSLTRYSIFGFAALCILVIGYYFFIRIILLLVIATFVENAYFIYLIIAVSGLTWLTIKINTPLLGFYVFVLVWLMLYIWLQRTEKIFFNNSKLSMAGTLFWIFLFSVSITAIIIGANGEKEWELRKKLADKIDVQSDPYNERQLSISFAYIDDDFLENNFLRFNNKETNRALRDSLMREGGYLNKYDSRLYVFNAAGKALFNEDAESLNTLNTIIGLQAKSTNTPHLYFYETSFDKFTFIFKRDARDTAGRLLGSFFVVSNPEQYNSDALYPELFRQANQNNPEESPVYSYAIYKKNILLTGPSNKYAFATSILPVEIPVSKYEKRINNNADELWYKASNDKVVVIAKKRDSVIEAITLFSYVFCAFLFLVAFFNLVALLLKAGGDYKALSRLLQWNIRTQVHSTIIFISILSFVIIGIATISFFIQRYEQNNTEKLSRTMQIMMNEMEKKLERQRVFDDQLAIYDSVANGEVQDLVNEVAEIHNVDVNVYDTSGNLQVTSQPLIYREGFLSKKIHPLAFYHLNRLRQVQYVQQENLATLSYLSIYAPIRDAEGHAYAFLNIPYFLSQRELKQEISYFLVTIINLNAFIFLIAGVIALFITNRVTRSFSIISEKMKEVNLGKTNEEIVWKRDDEIGELVAEYNKMVSKLETSAAALARSEREGAWREMARQVAHEIKNPLTPMKLSIQYLQRSIDNNTGDIKELTANVARTLIEQINHLAKIAFDFSQFANIGNTNPETFDLKEVLYSLRDLYQMNEHVELLISELPGEMLLYTDKTQMNRLFTNLFQNALEACIGKEKCRIEVHAVKEDGIVRISIKDNGEGIPYEMQSRIFSPNFTTKSSGTGLGLAMCKGIVEKAKGKIWFETTKGGGATFFVELPLVL
jgi:signal transduction histidine kinase